MSWSGLALVSDSELGQLEPEAVAPAKPWGRVTWSDARAEAKRDLRIWLEMDYPDVPGVADRVLDRWEPDYAFTSTGGAVTDRTSQNNDDEEDDLDLATIFTTIGTDRFYIGAAWGFDGLYVHMTGTRNAAASVLTVKYSGPTGFTALTHTDGTAVSGVTLAQSGKITWVSPSTWQRQREHGTGDEFFWIELSVSGALTASTSASQILCLRPPDGLKRCAAYLSLGHIYNGLSAGSPGEERWRIQSDKYFAMARDLYAGLKGKAGLWLDIDHSGSIGPGESQQNRGGHVFYRA